MDKKKIIFHIDANSAYLSWEAVYRLQHGEGTDLREIPAVVGGNQATRHGIVLAKSIPTKKYGIQTGEPLMQARRKCPGLVVVPPRYEMYMQCSAAMIDIMKDYSDKIQLFSIDECFLDYTGMEKVLGNPVEVAHKIRERVKKELGFTINIGISTNKLLAKMAGELKKPDMVHTLFPEEIPMKMWPLPVEELYMVGRATAPKMHAMGIYSIGDLAVFDLELIKYKLKSWGIMLYNFANGIEGSDVDPNGSVPYIKGIGNSTTIHFDVEEKYTAYKVLLSLVETVAMRLRYGGFCTRLISVSIKTSELKSYSHQKKFSIPTDCTNVIFETACNLFDNAWKGEPIRHLGVRVSELCTNEFVQLSLLENSREKQRKVDRAVDEIRRRHGAYSIIRSVFLHSRLSPLTGGVVEDFPVMTSIL